MTNKDHAEELWQESSRPKPPRDKTSITRAITKIMRTMSDYEFVGTGNDFSRQKYKTFFEDKRTSNGVIYSVGYGVSGDPRRSFTMVLFHPKAENIMVTSRQSGYDHDVSETPREIYYRRFWTEIAQLQWLFNEYRQRAEITRKTLARSLHPTPETSQVKIGPTEKKEKTVKKESDRKIEVQLLYSEWAYNTVNGNAVYRLVTEHRTFLTSGRGTWPTKFAPGTVSLRLSKNDRVLDMEYLP